jgi:general secretion pathway protein I
MIRPDRQHGFTLAEVLVALAVLAIGMSAALTAGGQVGRIAGDLRERTVAHWVAQNEITRLRLQRDAPTSGQQEGEVTMAGIDWHWELNIIDTPVGGLKRLTIAVSMDDRREDIIVTETGFVGRARPGYAVSPWEAGAQVDDADDDDESDEQGEGG